MWFDVLKAKDCPECEIDYNRYWNKTINLFQQNPNKIVGYFIPYWYKFAPERIEEWTKENDFRSIYIESVYMGKAERIGKGGFWFWKDEELRNILNESKPLLEKYNIPSDTLSFIRHIATTTYAKDTEHEDIYDLIASILGGKPRRTNPLRMHLKYPYKEEE